MDSPNPGAREGREAPREDPNLARALSLVLVSAPQTLPADRAGALTSRLTNNTSSVIEVVYRSGVAPALLDPNDSTVVAGGAGVRKALGRVVILGPREHVTLPVRVATR